MPATLYPLEAAEVQDWYSRLNAILNRDSQTPAKVPDIFAGQSTVNAGQISPLTSKLNSMKSDEYYSYATYSTTTDPVTGTVIRRQLANNIEATISSIEATIICRNKYTNSNGSHENGSNGYGSNGNGTRSNGNKSNGDESYGTCPASPLTNGTHSNGKKSNGWNRDGGNNYGSYSDSSGSRYPNTASQCSNGYESQGTCGEGTNSDGRFTFGTKVNGSEGNGSNGYGSNGNGTRTNGACPQGEVIDVSNNNK